MFPGSSGWPSSVSQTTLLGCLLSETVYFYRLKLAHTKTSVLLNVAGFLVLSQKSFKNSKNNCISQPDWFSHNMPQIFSEVPKSKQEVYWI